MIKINLLAEGKRPVAVRKARAAPAAGAPREWGILLLIGLTLVGVLAFGAWWWTLNREIGRNKEEIARSEEEVRQLEAIIREVEAFKRKKAELEHKIAVIEQLRANQSGPVRVMDEISRALPELLWLDRMEVGAANITLSGRAFNSNAVANFMENLDRVPEFEEPVLRDLQERGPVYHYTVVFNYSYL
ncbi:MAG: PilN domain-containing protein, partial [Candidatus Rokuibacteriota bacterium]